MDIVLLGGLFPLEYEAEIIKKSKGLVQNAANTLQWSIVKGFSKIDDCNLSLINLPYIDSFPSGYKDIIVPEFPFSYKNLIQGINVGFNNLKYYKLFSRFLSCKKYLNRWAKNTNERSVIMVYAIHSPFIKAAVEVKRKYARLRICLIVPDLPEHMGRPSNLLNNTLTIFERSMINKYLKEIDSFVLLSKYMEKPLNIGNKPWICMEGIFDPKQSIKLKYEKSNIKIIFYAGTLTERYGILNLIKAFSLIESEDYRLMICGGGDIIGRILELAKIDTRIIYLGQLERTKVNEMLQKATVLVNPRTSDHEFCKYSFPSKTLEYLASGKPTIMYKLPGIPDEYFNYCYALDDKSPQKLAEMIINVCETDVNELRKLTEQAHNFILKFKNPDIQCRKIYDMLNHL